MAAIAKRIELQPRQRASLASKEMALAIAASDRGAVQAGFERGIAAAESDVGIRRMVSHNRARGLVKMGAKEDGAAAAEALVNEYLDGFGLTLGDLPLTQPPELRARIQDYPSRSDDMRHLADALHVLADTKPLGQRGLFLIQAAKFYRIAWVPYSVVRVGQEIVDELIAIGDPEGARASMEQHVLPIVDDARLADLMVDVRAQYAVVLARAGAVEEARALMRTLEAYDVKPELSAQLRHQRELIELVAQTVLVDRGGSRRRQGPKVGRNNPCPCGSGLKYKRRHG